METLELDLIDFDFGKQIFATLREGPFGKDRKVLLDKWEKDEKTLDRVALAAMIDVMGKGRFAQRLATRVADLEPPYIY